MRFWWFVWDPSDCASLAQPSEFPPLIVAFTCVVFIHVPDPTRRDRRGLKPKKDSQPYWPWVFGGQLHLSLFCSYSPMEFSASRSALMDFCFYLRTYKYLLHLGGLVYYQLPLCLGFDEHRPC